MIKRNLSILIFLALLIPKTHANGDDWKLVGETHLKILFWPVYNASLYTHDGFYQEDQIPTKLEITYLRDFTASSLIERTATEWQHLGIKHQRSNDWLADLQTIWTDIKKGDRLAIVVGPSTHSLFYKNDDYLGSINDQDFSQAFLDIWLSPKSSQPKNMKELRRLE